MHLTSMPSSESASDHQTQKQTACRRGGLECVSWHRESPSAIPIKKQPVLIFLFTGRTNAQHTSAATEKQRPRKPQAASIWLIGLRFL